MQHLLLQSRALSIPRTTTATRLLVRTRTRYHNTRTRSLFTLPDLSTLSPFQSPEPQTYHERKILPYVRASSTPHIVQFIYMFFAIGISGAPSTTSSQT